MWSPGIGTVLHWQPPDVHILDTDPHLIERGCRQGEPIVQNMFSLFAEVLRLFD